MSHLTPTDPDNPDTDDSTSSAKLLEFPAAPDSAQDSVGVDATATPANPGPVSAAAPPSPWATTAATGLIATVVGLGVAELVAASSRRLQSPVISVGDRIVDAVPSWLKNLAIDWFGTADKLVLLLSIGATIGILSLGVGVVAGRRSLLAGAGAVGLAGLLGSAAAWRNRSDPDLLLAVPTVVGTLVAVGTLVFLTRWARRSNDTTPIGPPATLERRRVWLVLGSLLGLGFGAGLVGRVWRSRFDVDSQRAGIVLPAPVEPTPAPAVTSSGAAPTSKPVEGQAASPAGGAEATPSAEPERAGGADPAASPTPASGTAPTARPEVVDLHGMPGFEYLTTLYTPNSDFYRIDTALEIPQVDVNDWELKVTGLVDRPFTMSYSDLLAGVHGVIVEEDITMSCVSNEIGGNLVGHARWLGVRLDEILAQAGVQSGADQIVGRSVDGYTCGFPVGALDGRNALVAFGMNGEPLPTAHGFPARLVVPGLYGYVSATKWLTEIELTTFDSFDSYWVPRGWDAEAPIKTQARIDTPRPLIRIEPGETMIAGVAWAQTRGISRVEIQVDDGPWTTATLADAINDDSWRQWFLPWDATSGRHTVTVRATDGTGEVQTADRAAPQPNGASGRHQIVVLVA